MVWNRWPQSVSDRLWLVTIPQTRPSIKRPFLDKQLAVKYFRSIIYRYTRFRVWVHFHSNYLLKEQINYLRCTKFSCFFLSWYNKCLNKLYLLNRTDLISPSAFTRRGLHYQRIITIYYQRPVCSQWLHGVYRTCTPCYLWSQVTKNQSYKSIHDTIHVSWNYKSHHR